MNKGKYPYRLCRKCLQYEHRLVAGAVKGQLVDHINGDTLDNRLENLRLCSIKENSRNVRGREGTSRYKGVYFQKRARKWCASIRVDYKLIYLGLFELEEKAAEAYDLAAISHFGEFAKPNFSSVGTPLAA